MIKKLREDELLTQKELCKKIGIWQGELSKYENDKMSPSVNTLEKILKAMGYKLLINVGENDEWRKIIRVEARF